MGSSTRKKKEKQKDFQKAKLKVGKAKAKPDNFTDTSFRTRAIVVHQQSLSETAPDLAVQFRHNLSLAATSRSDNQRRDALAYLTSHLLSGGSASANPVGTVAILNKLLPLISDPAAPVRAQLLKLFRALPAVDVRPCASTIVLYVRAGITHLSSAVRDDALGVLEWLLDVAGDALVAAPGGWLKTLNGLGAMMGWESSTAPKTGNGWSTPKTSIAAAASVKKATPSNAHGQRYARQLAALTKFLEIGLRREPPAPYDPQAFWNSLYGMPFGIGSNSSTQPFGHLNLFGTPRDEDGEMYADREDRQRVYAKRWHPVVVKCVEDARKEGGAVGRAAATLEDVLKEGMGDYEGLAAR